MEGVSPTIVQAGKYKTEDNPLGPLSDEARAAMQAQVDATYSMFVRSVAKGRGVTPSAVKSGFGEGRMVNAKDAVASGIADKIGTLDEYLASERLSQ
jgi:ClpP class serine protease